MDEILFRDEVYAIQGAVFEVYKEIGTGFLEGVYQECLSREFDLRAIPYKAKPHLNLSYKNHPLSQTYQPDFVCYDKIIIELKATSEISGAHRAQILKLLEECRA